MVRPDGIWLVVAAANLAALFCAANPWFQDWQRVGVAFFAIEAILFVVVYLPVVVYQLLVRKRGFRESFTVAARALMDIVTGMP